jgi:predicted amidohydrolase
MNLIKIASIALELRTPLSFEEYHTQMEHEIATAAENGAHLVLFPEYCTTPLACLHPEEAVTDILPRYSEKLEHLFATLAKTYNVTLVAGTHLTKTTHGIVNRCNVFNPQGKLVGFQDKIHLTPWERSHWQLSAGNTVSIFDIGIAKIAMLICYDSEFPELARMARAGGADIILVPSATDDGNGVARIRYCCAARAIENQVFVAISHTLGSLPLDGMRSNHGNAALLSPCDTPFAAGGILAESPRNIPAVQLADLDLDALAYSRTHGAVTTWQDRRKELYTA